MSNGERRKTIQRTWPLTVFAGLLAVPIASAHEIASVPQLGSVAEIALEPGVAARVRIPRGDPASSGGLTALTSILFHNSGLVHFAVESQNVTRLEWETNISGQPEHRILHLLEDGELSLRIDTNLPFRIWARIVFHSTCPCLPVSVEPSIQPQAIPIWVSPGTRIEASSRFYGLAIHWNPVPAAAGASDWTSTVPELRPSSFQRRPLSVAAPIEGVAVLLVGGVDPRSAGAEEIPLVDFVVHVKVGKGNLGAPPLPVAALFCGLVAAAGARRQTSNGSRG